jgi:hypothetical protein
MRRSLPVISLVLAILLLNSTSMGQTDRFAYAVTDEQQEGANWSFLRKIDLNTGQYSKVLLDGNDVSLRGYDAGTRQQFNTPLTDARYGNAINAAFGTGVAAMAYDRKNNRIWYTPMFIDQLRYIDLKTMKVFFVTGHAFTGMSEKTADQANIVTRMAIAADGNGYALTNDAQHLIQFTIGKKPRITDLGALVDAPGNTGVSIHSSCTSFGGDVVADDEGNLYVFSARNHVFKVELETKVATHLGSVTGLPANFTVNGAAVNDKNQILVSSAVAATSYYTVDTKTWAASADKVSGTIWRSSDLANSNLLVTAKSSANNIIAEIITRVVPEALGSGRIQVYPNPVINNRFTLQFNQLESGNYTIQVTDVMGRQVSQQIVNISGDNQTENITLHPSAAKGVYLVKVMDSNSKGVFSKKIIVQ